MRVDCQKLRRELSSYLDGEVEAGLRAELDAHLAKCRCCSVLVDTTQNAVRVIADERVFILPIGFSERLHAFLKTHIESRK